MVFVLVRRAKDGKIGQSPENIEIGEMRAAWSDRHACQRTVKCPKAAPTVG